MKAITLRKSVPDDSEFVYQTTKAAVRPYVELAYGPWDEDHQRELHIKRFKPEEIQIVVVDGEDVGYLAWAQEGEEINLRQIFLDPAHHSRGIGQACLKILMAHWLPIRLRVMKVNPRAQAFYQNLGFVVTGEIETHHLMRWTPPG